MPKTITSSEAKARFGAMIKWAVENQDDVIVRQYGDPAVVMVPFAQYEQILAWREQARRESIIKKLGDLRREIQEATPTIDEAEAYRQAGMSERVIRETLEADQARKGYTTS